jgi:hypothetical protein
MKKTVQIVTIPLGDKGGYKVDDLIKKPAFEEAGESEIFLIANHNNSQGIWQAQQLLVVSNDGITENCNWYIDDKNQLRKNVVFDKEYWEIRKTYKEVIASYPQLEGTLSISKETIEEWINADTPEEGNVEIDDTIYCSVVNSKVLYGDPIKLDPQGNLLLKFDKEITDQDISNAAKKLGQTVENIRSGYLSIEKAKPPIPTDEEIEKKAELLSVENCRSMVFPEDNWKDGFIFGYKQALKDLGHE